MGSLHTSDMQRIDRAMLVSLGLTQDQTDERMNEMNMIPNNTVHAIPSTEVAEMTSKEHRHLLRDIQTYIGYIATEAMLFPAKCARFPIC